VFVVVVLQVTVGIKLNPVSQPIEKMGETVEFMAEQGEGFSGIPEVLREAELLANEMERLETLCHSSTSAPIRQTCDRIRFDWLEAVE
jgi:hypothetical protein